MPHILVQTRFGFFAGAASVAADVRRGLCLCAAPYSSASAGWARTSCCSSARERRRGPGQAKSATSACRRRPRDVKVVGEPVPHASRRRKRTVFPCQRTDDQNVNQGQVRVFVSSSGTHDLPSKLHGRSLWPHERPGGARGDAPAPAHRHCVELAPSGSAAHSHPLDAG